MTIVGPFFNLSSQQIATHAVKLLKLEATLDSGATLPLYLQLFDSPVAVANGTVPEKCWPAQECGYKEFEHGELVFNTGCYLAISTTDTVLTLATGGNILDILNIELIGPEQPAGTAYVGDLTTSVQSLQVWADGGAVHKLQSVVCQNNIEGTAAYLLLFAWNNPQAGDKPIDMFVVKANATLNLNFGIEGRDVFALDSTGAAHNGCTLALSSTPNLLTVPTSHVTLKAEYFLPT